MSMYGEWQVTAPEYAVLVQRFAAEIGRMDWAAVQDYMCEPAIISGGSVGFGKAVGTGKSIIEHQRLTIRSVQDLTELAPDIPWAPVLQGWELDDYLRHFDMYEAAGIDLAAFPVVGVGSVCRRQHTNEIAALIKELHAFGLKLHGFGVKMRGLKKVNDYLASADSLAWSFAARRSDPLEIIAGSHI